MNATAPKAVSTRIIHPMIEVNTSTGVEDAGSFVLANDPRDISGMVQQAGQSAGDIALVDIATRYMKWETVPGNLGNPAWSDPNNPGTWAPWTDSRRIAFYRWMRGRGLVIGETVYGNDLQTVKIVNVYIAAPGGKWTAIGQNQIVKNDDTAFGMAVSVMASALGIGVVWAAANAAVSGKNLAGAGIGLAQAAIGVDTPVTPSGGNTMFDSWDFSSGESFPAMSDAQEVDYGFGTIDYAGAGIDTSGLDINGFGGASVSDPTFNTGEGYSFNSTPEVTTNDFGTQVTQPAFSDARYQANNNPSAADIPLSLPASVAPLVKAGVGATAGGGTGSPKGVSNPAKATSSMDVLGTVGNALAGVTDVLGVAAQKTGGTPQGKGTFAGQLTPTGGVPGTFGGIPVNTLMIAGAVLLGLAFALHASGK